MKPVDYVLLIIFVPMFLLNCYAWCAAQTNPLVQAGVAQPRAKAHHIFVPLIIIALVALHVWG